MKESEYILLLKQTILRGHKPLRIHHARRMAAPIAENEQIATSYQRIWEKSEAYGKTFSPDLDTDFLKVQARIRKIDAPIMRVTLGQKSCGQPLCWPCF